MVTKLQLRPATMQDADCLFAWRNDPETRKASHNTDEVLLQTHMEWLAGSLENPRRRLLVAEENGVPVGTVRADYSSGVWELSWIVAPDARGRGVAKTMVLEMASTIDEPIRAEVKVGNQSSARIAKFAGMKLVDEVDGVLHFRRLDIAHKKTR